MTGENEHEREGAGNPMPPDDSLSESVTAAGESSAPESTVESRRSRPFGAWGAAQSQEPSGPSFWQRTSERIKRLFTRPASEIEAQDDEIEAELEPEVVGGFEGTGPVPEIEPLAHEPLHAPAEEAPAEEAPAEVVRAEEVLVEEVLLEEAPAEVVRAEAAPAVEAPAEEAKEDLKFLWTADDDSRVEPEAREDAAVISAMPENESSADSVEPVESMESATPIEEPQRAKRPSLLQRLFSRKPAPEDEDIPDTDEHEVPSVVGSTPMEVGASQPMDIDATLSMDVGATQPIDVGATQPTDIDATLSMDVGATQSVDVGATQPIDVGATQPMDVHDLPHASADALDEALPMDVPPVELTVDFHGDAAPPVLAAEPPKKAGFFARLFGRKSAGEPLPRALTAEPEADGVVQLDAVDDGFATARSEFAPPEHAPEQPFATVDDALPLDTPTFEPQPAITESAFAPPPVEVAVTPAPPAPPAPTSDEHQFFGGNTFDFDTPAVDDRTTMEVDTSAVDDRATLEVDAPVDDGRPTAEIAARTGEEDRDTDEFDMVTLAEPAVSPLEGKTAEVPKVGFIQKLFGKTKPVTQVEPAVAPPPSANPTFLVQKFRTFYNEVVVYKNQKSEFTAGFATAIVTDYTADLSPEQAAESLNQRLHQMLELQLAESTWMGGEIAELYPDAQYAMAVLADEMLTHLEWPGQGAWGKHRLELTVFKTAASDIELFKRIDKLLKNGVRTVGTRDLARVYLLTIASGFQGKFRPFALPRALAEYRRRLYEFVYGGDALMLYADDRRIFPEAETATVVGKAVSRFSMAQRWAAILVLLLTGYTVISQLTWNRLSAELKDMTGRVEQARTATTAPPNQNGSGGRQ